MGFINKQIRDNTILEDMDSDLDLSADLNYNYDVINLKDPTNPFYEAVKNILVVYSKRAGNDDDEEINPEKALASPSLLAVKVQIWMQMNEP